MPTKVRDIISAVIVELSQVPGVATQIYAADRIKQYVQNAFLLEFETFWWPDYMTFAQSPLDGVNGLLTVDLAGPLGPIREYKDIHSVWPNNSDRKLRALTQSMNPFSLVSGGTQSWYVTPDLTIENRPLKVWPVSASGSIVVWGRQRPIFPFTLDDNIYMDNLLLQYDAAWMYSVDDGTVPAQVNKFQVLAQNRRKAIHSSYSNMPVPLDPRYTEDMGGIDNTPFVLDQDPLA